MFSRLIIVLALPALSLSAQEAPKLTESFSFSLSPYRQFAVSRTIELMKERDDAQRTLELEKANEGLFSGAIDLLRFVPVAFGASESGLGDDFFTPSYLKVNYDRRPAVPILFQNP